MHTAATTEHTVRFLGLAADRLRRQLAGRTARELRAEGKLTSWSEFCAATSPPESISMGFGRMLLNVPATAGTSRSARFGEAHFGRRALSSLQVHGLSAPMVTNLLHRFPTPRALAEALDSHARACELRELPAEQSRWLLAEVFVPGKKRRKLSETVSSFFMAEELPAAAQPQQSESQRESQSESQPV